ncbi:MAG: methyltransferase domain-containing protein [Nanoarchaeota archaeon]
MKERLLKVLACPSCQSDLKLSVKERAQGEIKEGILVCVLCKEFFHIRHFIPRFIKDDSYAKNFSKEWGWYQEVVDKIREPKEQESYFLRRTGFSKKEVKNKLLLDVGQGAGIGMDWFLKYGAEVVGMDISYAVDAAFKLHGLHPKAHIIQASVFKLPFKKAAFDYIYSVGVLHHTPNCKKAFFQLPKLLKKKGKIAIWLYPWQGFYSRLSDFWRFFSTKLPSKFLFHVCKLGVEPLYRLRQLPIIGGIGKSIPISTHPNPYWRMLDTYDWYSPKYQSKHTNQEVVQWFKQANLKNIKVLSDPVSVQGTKN